MNKLFVVVLLSAIVLASGCTSQQQNNQQNQKPTEPELKESTMTISHTFYNPSTITVNNGDMVRINAISARGTGLESGLGHNHGITIDEYNINVAAPSETTPVVINFVADKEGTFTIYCKSCWDGPFGREHPDIRATLVVNP